MRGRICRYCPTVLITFGRYRKVCPACVRAQRRRAQQVRNATQNAGRARVVDVSDLSPEEIEQRYQQALAQIRARRAA